MSTKSIVAAIIVFSLALCFMSDSNAQVPIVFQQGLGGYDGVHDTYYQTGDPIAIHGAETEWEWDGSDAGGFNFGMIRFDNLFGTNPDQVPPDATIISAILTLTVTNEGSSDQIATMHELVVPFDDTQDFFSFGDGSGAEPLPGQDYVEEPIASIPGPSVGTILELDVTESIKRIQAGGENFGWVFIPTGSNGVGVASSEAGSGRPMLTITIEGTEPPFGVRQILYKGKPAVGFKKGEPVNVVLTITNPSGSADVTVKETIPAGWTASNISDGGALADGVITWTLTALSGDKSLTYTATAPSDAATFATFSGSINDLVVQLGETTIRTFIPLYKTRNVLAVGVWNSDSGSSDLAVTAEVVDNNGVIYVQDSSAPGGWPSTTSFRWKVVFFDDGTGAEEPGWQERDFANDTEANDWIIQTDVGFTVGHGGNDAENGETLIQTFDETVYTRSIFDAQNYESITELTIKLAADDEAVAWLNGVFVGFTASGTSDRGETAENYVFDTTISGGAGGLEGGSNPTDYSGGGTRIFSIPVDLVESDVVSVIDWTVY